MIDFLFGIYLAGLLIRGWIRGLVREALDLAGLVLGVVLAFRMSGPFGNFLADRFGVSPEMARIGAAIALFLVVGAGLGILAHYLSKLMRLPGLNLTNRFLGAALAGAWGITLLLLLVTLIRALPLPSGVDETLDRSKVVSALAGPDSRVESAFQRVLGDRVLSSVLALEHQVGMERVVPQEGGLVRLSAASADELSDQPGDADLLFASTNRERAAASLDPLAWSDGLAGVAADQAKEMYTEGYLGFESPAGVDINARIQATGMRLSLVEENLALASSARAAHAALLDDAPSRRRMLVASFNRVGIAAVRGPYGLMVVEVFGS